MKFIGGIIFHIFANAIAILAAAYFIHGFLWSGNFIELVVAAAILTAINTFIRPIIRLFLGPFIILTFGLFLIVINGVMLYILDLWSAPLKIQGIEALLFGTLIVGAVNVLAHMSVRSQSKD